MADKVDVIAVLDEAAAVIENRFALCEPERQIVGRLLAARSELIAPRALYVGARGKALLWNAHTDWYEKYQRVVEGLNNEGDSIGGDPPRGLRHLAEEGAAALTALRTLTERMDEHPDDYEGPCWCAVCRSYMAEDCGAAS